MLNFDGDVDENGDYDLTCKQNREMNLFRYFIALLSVNIFSLSVTETAWEKNKYGTLRTAKNNGKSPNMCVFGG